jgi:hypothetical protein
MLLAMTNSSESDNPCCNNGNKMWLLLENDWILSNFPFTRETEINVYFSILSDISFIFWAMGFQEKCFWDLLTFNKIILWPSQIFWILHFFSFFFSHAVSILLADSANSVKQALMEHSVTKLAVFFGKQKANDVILSHMITFLNDKEDSQVRNTFF